MTDLTTRTFASVSVGEALPVVTYPLTVHRLVVAAGSTRDHTAIHHNDDHARATGAPGMYASAILLQGMWERSVRDWAGPGARIAALRGFRMRRFTVVGSLVEVHGEVVSLQPSRSGGLVELAMSTVVDGTITVGPGSVLVALD
ncbi:hotdog family protein [Aeromicrobium choanae]|uniref:Acyl dehydratase n=1 Tax=Aeromicrobium choanae TaxID=1736691 RepID=A0A1T4YWZ4_9ACTN|nr:hypothetical protein [Aeromicrobium choanae]SKB06163.1 Acyl dehydratase [Aeromicrobium choanae]